MLSFDLALYSWDPPIEGIKGFHKQGFSLNYRETALNRLENLQPEKESGKSGEIIYA